MPDNFWTKFKKNPVIVLEISVVLNKSQLSLLDVRLVQLSISSAHLLKRRVVLD